jgi:hypothetical protein
VTRTVIGGKIEHLPPLHPDFRGLRQVRAAATTQARLMPQPLVRFVDQRQRRPRMSRLPARFAAAFTAQRPGSRLGERGVRRRRRAFPTRAHGLCRVNFLAFGQFGSMRAFDGWSVGC